MLRRWEISSFVYLLPVEIPYVRSLASRDDVKKLEVVDSHIILNNIDAKGSHKHRMNFVIAKNNSVRRRTNFEGMS